MKKYIALLMMFILCLGCANNVFASEQYVSEGTASSTVTYHADSSYMIIIPETIDAHSTMMLTAASVNIDESETVRVKVTNLDSSNYLSLYNKYNGLAQFSLTRSDNNSEIVNNGEVASFLANCNESTFGVNFSPVSYEIGAGDYSGTIEFSISLEAL